MTIKVAATLITQFNQARIVIGLKENSFFKLNYFWWKKKEKKHKLFFAEKFLKNLPKYCPKRPRLFPIDSQFDPKEWRQKKPSATKEYYEANFCAIKLKPIPSHATLLKSQRKWKHLNSKTKNQIKDDKQNLWWYFKIYAYDNIKKKNSYTINQANYILLRTSYTLHFN